MTEAKAKTPTAWEILQAPFDVDSISLLPRYIGKKEDKGKDKRRCAECGTTHDFPAIHLSYVGHADITMRLNEADPTWTWEPMAYDAQGLPALDARGGLWAWLTICGVRKPAYGDPGLAWDGKSKAGTPDGMKEAIGDMLRNGAMRFGAGTQLWSKSDKAKQMLVGDDDTPHEDTPPKRDNLASEKQVAMIFGLGKQLGWGTDETIGTVKKSAHKDHPGDLTKAEASKFIDALKNRVDAAEKAEAVADELGATPVEDDHADEEIRF